MRRLPLIWVRAASQVILIDSVLVVGLSCGEPVDAPRSPAAVSVSNTAIERNRISIPSPSALDLLLTESVFVGARVGFAGTPSRQARALRTLLADPRRADLLRQLWHDGTPAGRLYALVGFALTDSAAFQRNVRLIIGDKRIIPTAMGCIAGSERMGRLAREIHGEFADEFRSDSMSARVDALMDSLDARLMRSQPPGSEVKATLKRRFEDLRMKAHSLPVPPASR